VANAVRRACAKHKIPHWHPHQLRHACKVRIDEAIGREAFDSVSGVATASDATQATLGHSNRKMTARYGSPAFGLAAITMEQYG
jgi:integrase